MLTNSNYQLIVGKWTLQRQRVVFHIDSTQTMDSTYTPSIDNRVDIQFNPDNSFVNIKYYPIGGGNTGEGGLTGLYGFSGSAFSMTSRGIQGLRSGDPEFADDAMGNLGTPVLLAYSINVNQLTINELDIEIVYTYSYNYAQHFKAESYYYFSK